ncbi:polyribonucleotide nucleotidyltransferase [Opitutus terrae]|uniref:Polyribonucleotide nucleotidyltransferase n=1 Tax=Opitutus terrae (strain DSM 11246 / JCM 15787 / PB90-1) TaxID=452637 RepID=PNP_OPITP|nr:polyribonucleotide nucleotidyltransferase [Opitutus terrae]B1ZS98.1 RecName: Full=Polyribonucleotide nucleotidyltransferase; AltName: Full=Polynucleotide phosphorylase; Short=PNPase [Opitutus terrae PB90-1]ACB75697.1 Polyribonucleotide nucleotidyltransferase [Opitutus terrae PB90-1]
MNQKYSVTVPELGITFSTGSIAQLANGAVNVQVGETNVFVTACVAQTTKPGQDWFPLTVDYREKYAAAGRFPGGYFKREGRPSEKEILTSRLCDRPCRPLFPEGFLNEVQIIGQLFSADLVNESDISMVNGASAALAISDIPWNGPIAAVRVAEIEGKFVANPTIDQMFASSLDLIYVGNEKDMLMIEGSADQIPEERFIEALAFGHESIQPILKAIKELVAQCGKPKGTFPLVGATPEARTIIERVVPTERLIEAIFGKEKAVRANAVKLLKEEAKAALTAELGEGKFTDVDLNVVFEDLQYKAYRKTVLERGVRADGRGQKDIRPLQAQVGVLPRVHGSAMFQRGDTQNIALTTLGPTKDAQDLDALTGGVKSKSFLLHYNFPPFSVGETGRFTGPGRREIGHGALAERSLVPVLPPEDVFPYSIRVVSEIMASNGSTSMASICGGCLSLMDAGVPIIAPVAGISCGLMTQNASDGSIEKWVTITDILGEEDHFGDMDFKLAGTSKGITGFQLDLKINGLPFEIAKTAIMQARDARMEILKVMLGSLPAPRADLSKYAPRIQTIQIDPEKIGLLIGPGGKTIRRITETTGAQIDIAEDDSGKVFVYSNNAEAMNRAIQEIDSLCGGGGPGGSKGPAIEVGKIYTGRVTGVKEFGCFVECTPGNEGLCHVSELADFRVRRTEDVVKMGDSITVKCIGIDERSGKVRLSRKAAMKELEAQKQSSEAAPAQ